MSSKRINALWAISGVAVVNAGASFAPTISAELPKHAALQLAEIGMCIAIANIYSPKKHTQEEVLAIVESLGGGAALAYGATSAGHVLIKEILNWGGPPAWALKGMLGGGLTFAVGISFLAYCEERWGS